MEIVVCVKRVAATDSKIKIAADGRSIDTAQLVVAWAGEMGDMDEPSSQRLGWWRTDLVGEGAEYDHIHLALKL